MYEIFTDVAVDINPEVAIKENVKYVPMEYIIGEEVRHCDAPESMETMHRYYDDLRKKVNTQTSQIT
ncbi:MAG: DegV family protein, partial [Lachnospira sp.]|nr:DegV family protein [Lachnospira sp.]